MKELELRNLNNTYYKMDNKRKYSLYGDPINNNLILFVPMDNNTIESVCNATVSLGAYEYLIDILNNNSNIVVLWSQVEGTTSDYRIYHDFQANDILEYMTYDEIMKLLPDGNLHYKFVEWQNGVESKIEFNKSA